MIMKIFLKFGLPWAISITAAFYFGLKLGSEKVGIRESTVPSNESISPITKTEKPNNQTSLKKTKIPFNNDDIKSSSSPKLPPNLIRIMEGGGIIERLGAFLDAVRAMDSSNVQDVISAFEALPRGYGRHLEMKLLMRSWSAIDPESALAYANETLDPKSERRFAISEVLAGWANRSPDEAISWASENSDLEGGYGTSLMFGIIKGLAENNLDRANEVFKNLPEGNAKWQASTFLAQQYAELGVEKAISWANQFPDNDSRMRSTTLAQIAAKLARQDIEATAKWAESMKNDKAALLVIDNLLTQWVPKDPVEASKWVTKIPEMEKKFHGIKQLTSRWSLTDPIATAEWLNSFPPSPQMDPVVNEFVNRISTRDPEGAAGWALSILDPETKEKALSKAINAWNHKDPEAANQWKRANQID
jgi:hypothetical protein